MRHCTEDLARTRFPRKRRRSIADLKRRLSPGTRLHPERVPWHGSSARPASRSPSNPGDARLSTAVPSVGYALGLTAAVVLGSFAVLASARVANADAPVAHDTFSDAQVMTLGHSVLGSTVGAGVEPGEPGVRHRRQHLVPRHVHRQRHGPGRHRRLGLRHRARRVHRQRGGRPDPGRLQRRRGRHPAVHVGFAAVAGTTYYFRVSGFRRDRRGPVHASTSAPTCPRRAARHDGPTSRSWPARASRPLVVQPGPVVPANASPTGGAVTMGTAAPPSTPCSPCSASRRRGSSPRRATTTSSAAPTSQVTFTALPGVRYYIVGGGFNGATGSLRLAVTNPAGSGGTAPGPLPVAPIVVPDAPTAPSAIAIEEGATVSWTAPAPGDRRSRATD